VPILALKGYHDQRSNLDQEQEVQLEIVRRKYREKIKPLLERVINILFRQLSSFKEASLLPKRWLFCLNILKLEKKPDS
jgi:hypothetical protein